MAAQLTLNNSSKTWKRVVVVKWVLNGAGPGKSKKDSTTHDEGNGRRTAHRVGRIGDRKETDEGNHEKNEWGMMSCFSGWAQHEQNKKTSDQNPKLQKPT